jgi:hypothetical protein
MTDKKIIKPSQEIIRQAKLFPNGWVYKIQGKYLPNQAVPTEDIQGAWKVDCNGNIEGDLILNPNYKQK